MCNIVFHLLTRQLSELHGPDVSALRCAVDHHHSGKWVLVIAQRLFQHSQNDRVLNNKVTERGAMLQRLYSFCVSKYSGIIHCTVVKTSIYRQMK